MAQSIYDENGKKIGEVKTEEEALNDSWLDFVEGVGCVAIPIGGFLILLVAILWMIPFLGEPALLFVKIPVILATFVAGAKLLNLDHISPPWGFLA